MSQPLDWIADRIADQFEHEWREGRAPRIEDFLPQVPQPLRSELLYELLKVELELRTESGETPQPDEYLGRFAAESVIHQAFADNAQADSDAAPAVDGSDAITGDSTTGDSTTGESSAEGHQAAPSVDAIPPTSSPATGDSPAPDAAKDMPARGANALRDFARRHELLATSGTAEQIAALWHSRYEVLEEVGRGGMGLVYRGEHKTLGMIVAIKILNPGACSKRFHREARVLAQIRSPHVVGVHDFEVLPGGVPILVMEWIEGKTLSELLLESRWRISEEQALPWMRQVCEGMMAAAREGVIHRDLKPSNVLIDQTGRAKVADFGLARRVSGTDDLSHSGGVMGTPLYMAPEQAEDPRKVDTRADVYSFGATFYHVLTGTPPFCGETHFAVLLKQKTEPLVPPRLRYPGLSNHLSDVIARCLEKSPADRFQSFQELLQELDSPTLVREPWRTTDVGTHFPLADQYRARRGTYLKRPRQEPLADSYSLPNGSRIDVLVGNIVDQHVDAIVSSDQSDLLMRFGVSAAIRKAAGENVFEEAARLAPVHPGRAVVTSAGALQSRFVFHAVPTGFTRGRLYVPSPHIVAEVITDCLHHADTFGLTSIAFPLIATGASRFPEDICLDTLFRILAVNLAQGTTTIRNARIVLFPDTVRWHSSHRSTVVDRDRPQIAGYTFFDHHQSIIQLPDHRYGITPVSDGRLLIAVSDHFGSGFEAVQRMLSIGPAMRDQLDSQRSLDTALSEVNLQLRKDHAHKLISIITAVLDPQTHQVEIANAGHCPAIIQRADGTQQRVEASRIGLPLGALSDSVYETQTLLLEPGDFVCLFTNGLVEARGLSRVRYGLNSLTGALRSAKGSVEHAGAELIRDAQAHTGDSHDYQEYSLILFGRT